MAHKLYEGPKPNIIIVKLINELNYDDMTCDEEIGLNSGRRLYVLLDASAITASVPEGFLDGAKHSFFINKNLIHMALYVEAPALRMIGKMVSKVTRLEHKLSIHSDYDSAMRHLLNLTREAPRIIDPKS